MPALRIALTGGIAAGKSTIAKHLARLGAVVIDYDVLAREVVAPGSSGLAALLRHFGSQILATDGSLDRTALASLVFSDAEQRLALNNITHPLIRYRASEAEEAAGSDSVVVHDIPLLAETGGSQEHPFDAVIVVEADESTQIARLTATRALDREAAIARIQAQANNAQRRAIATHLIDGTVQREEMLTKVTTLWHDLTGSSGYDDLRGEYSRDR